MRRLCVLILSVGFMPLLVGCVEDAKADDKNKAAEKAKADSAQADNSKKAKRPPLEFAELPTDDPLVRNAQFMRDQVAELEEELLEQLDELRSNLEEAKANPAKLRESLESFIDTTRMMKQKTAMAGESINVVAEKTNELSRSSRHLGDSYRSLASLYRKKARDYSEKKLRDRLLQFAKDNEAIADAIPERVKALEAVQRKLPSLKKKIREVNSFLNDAVGFLNAHPGIGSDPKDRYTGEFESFAVSFSEWIRTLDELRQALRERAVSKLIQEDFRKEMLVLAKLEESKREEQARLEREKIEALAKAEREKREEETRLAKQAETEKARLAQQAEEANRLREESETKRERGSITFGYSIPHQTPIAVPVSMSSCQTVTYCVSSCPQPSPCVNSRPQRFRLFPLFRRCP